MTIGIVGAGAIGGFVAIALEAAGQEVRLFSRSEQPLWQKPRVRLLSGKELTSPRGLPVEVDRAGLGDCQVILICAKSQHTEQVCEQIRGFVSPSSLVVSLQNGITNYPTLRQSFGDQACAGMFTFNVVREGDVWLQKTDGPILVEERLGLAPLVANLGAAGLKSGLRADMPAVLRGKLLLNLNNGLCAALGMPLAAMLQNPLSRKAFAAAIGEGPEVFARRGEAVGQLGVLSPKLVSMALKLPNPWFGRVARRLTQVDPKAKTSTLQDIERGRRTEIDYLSGQVVTLGEGFGLQVPVNRWIVAQVKRLEESGNRDYATLSDLERVLVAAAGASA